jgi:hypothetical protein
MKESDVASVVSNIAGLVLNLAGVVLLFRYGMPFRVRTGGVITIISEQIDPATIHAEKVYEFWGWVGLGAIVIGTGLQIVAAVLAARSGRPSRRDRG